MALICIFFQPNPLFLTFNGRLLLRLQLSQLPTKHSAWSSLIALESLDSCPKYRQYLPFRLRPLQQRPSTGSVTSSFSDDGAGRSLVFVARGRCPHDWTKTICEPAFCAAALTPVQRHAMQNAQQMCSDSHSQAVFQHALQLISKALLSPT